MNFYSNRYVWFDKNLPFTPKYCELIYVETEYNPYTNEVKEVFRKPYSEGLRAKAREKGVL